MGRYAEARERHNSNQRAAVQARRLMGLCARCNNPAREGKSECTDCADSARAYRNQLIRGESRAHDEAKVIAEIGARYRRRLTAGRAAGVSRERLERPLEVVRAAERLARALRLVDSE